MIPYRYQVFIISVVYLKGSYHSFQLLNVTPIIWFYPPRVTSWVLYHSSALYKSSGAKSGQ